MRTLVKLHKQLESTGFSVAYHHFEEGHSPEPPFLIYLVVGSENVGADNWVYQKIEKVEVELYTKKKDTAVEQTIETLFDRERFYFDKVESYISSEKLYQIIYTLTLLGGQYG